MIKFFVALVLFAGSGFAHEGPHGPEQKVAPHGGILRDSASLMFELVKNGDVIKIYPLTHQGKSIEAKLVEIDKAKTTLMDAKKKPISYQLVAEGDYLSVKFEKGTSHRYSLTLVGRYEGKENKGNWQIELGGE